MRALLEGKAGARLASAIACALALTACGDDEGTGGAGAAGAGGASSTATTVAAGGAGEGGGGGGGAPPTSTECPSGITSDPDVQQALPQAVVDTAMVAPTGTVHAVAAGGNVQAAIDAANPGDVITLEAGATFTGTITLTNKPGAEWITLRTSTADAELPPEGGRVSPSDAPKLAKLVLPADTGAVVSFAPGAHHWRLVGLEIAPSPGVFIHSLVDVGSGISVAADVPHHIVIDRTYLHGDPAAGSRRGIALGGAHVGVVGSYFADFKEVGADSQAIGGWNGPGPFKIVNNHLEGAGENIMFGGAASALPSNVPSDIEVCRNHFFKPLAWKGQSWTIKNLFEIKNAQRVLFAGNVLENNWAAAQNGFAVVLTPRGEGGAVPGVVHDLTFVSNHIVHSASGIGLSGNDDTGPSGGSARVVIANNLLEDLDRAAHGGDGRVFQLTTPELATQGLKIEHNTATIAGNSFLVMGDSVPVASGFVFRNNLMPHGDYGAFGTGKGEGTAALAFFAPGAIFTSNAVFAGGTAASYPAGNLFPADVAAVGFQDFAGGDFALSASSPLAGAGSDGKDVGADLAVLAAAIAGVTN